MRIEVVKQIDESNRENWEFNIIDRNAVFVTYFKEVKFPGKRKFTITDFWDQYQNRSSNIPQPGLPDHIRSEALSIFQTMIKVKTWDEFKNVNQ